MSGFNKADQNRIIISSLKSNHVNILLFICFVFIHYLTCYFANFVLIVIVKALSNLLCKINGLVCLIVDQYINFSLSLCKLATFIITSKGQGEFETNGY